MNAAINTALFCGILAIMFGIQAIDDNSAEHEVAREELAKQRQQERCERAAREMCGNGIALVDGSGAVRCEIRKALKAGRAKL